MGERRREDAVFGPLGSFYVWKEKAINASVFSLSYGKGVVLEDPFLFSSPSSVVAGTINQAGWRKRPSAETRCTQENWPEKREN